jgi:hypothetical protein
VEALRADQGRLRSEKDDLASHNVALEDQNAALKSGAQQSALGEEMDRIGRHLQVAKLVLGTLGSVLPPGLVPEGVRNAMDRAAGALDSAKSLAGEGVTEAALATLVSAGDELTRNSPLRELLGKAAGALLPLAGAAGPLGGIALALSVGCRLGADEYRRWRARILAAPYDPTLIAAGQISPDSARLCLDQSAIFSRVLSSETATPGFYANLVNIVLSDNAPDEVAKAYGPLFPSRQEMVEGLDEFRRALLADQSANDITDEHIAGAAEKLAKARPDLDPGQPTIAQLNAVIDSARPSRVDPTVSPDPSRAALDALVFTVGKMREQKTDVADILVETKP